MKAMLGCVMPPVVVEQVTGGQVGLGDGLIVSSVGHTGQVVTHASVEVVVGHEVVVSSVGAYDTDWYRHGCL